MSLSRMRLRAFLLALLSVFALTAATPAEATPEPEPVIPWRLVAAPLMMCESGGDPEAINESETETHWDGKVGSYGLYQFSHGTWMGITYQAFRLGLTPFDWGHVRPDYAPERIQTLMAELLWDKGEGRSHWGCWGTVKERLSI